ncbi:uncharacterized protein SCDLUD_004749 [Saccharomycodes ludwigii]|uniref:uncharacterized protein n=1 Tax=Saccharomycodes ludwigii TaxID=36035 RepID=UPI001E88806B|nr:hypothetical protein SCDLUD_004749 [Saccharomycodes ludwigii]KAH3899311.1 hypothetical protein SCDLUD_004749 [Saccharomycodes ludwigii]
MDYVLNYNHTSSSVDFHDLDDDFLSVPKSSSINMGILKKFGLQKIRESFSAKFSQQQPMISADFYKYTNGTNSETNTTTATSRTGLVPTTLATSNGTIFDDQKKILYPFSKNAMNYLKQSVYDDENSYKLYLKYGGWDHDRRGGYKMYNKTSSSTDGPVNNTNNTIDGNEQLQQQSNISQNKNISTAHVSPKATPTLELKRNDNKDNNKISDNSNHENKSANTFLTNLVDMTSGHYITIAEPIPMSAQNEDKIQEENEDKSEENNQHHQVVSEDRLSDEMCMNFDPVEVVLKTMQLKGKPTTSSNKHKWKKQLRQLQKKLLHKTEKETNSSEFMRELEKLIKNKKATIKSFSNLLSILAKWQQDQKARSLEELSMNILDDLNLLLNNTFQNEVKIYEKLELLDEWLYQLRIREASLFSSQAVAIQELIKIKKLKREGDPDFSFLKMDYDKAKSSTEYDGQEYNRFLVMTGKMLLSNFCLDLNSSYNECSTVTERLFFRSFTDLALIYPFIMKQKVGEYHRYNALENFDFSKNSVDKLIILHTEYSQLHDNAFPSPAITEFLNNFDINELSSAQEDRQQREGTNEDFSEETSLTSKKSFVQQNIQANENTLANGSTSDKENTITNDNIIASNASKQIRDRDNGNIKTKSGGNKNPLTNHLNENNNNGVHDNNEKKNGNKTLVENENKRNISSQASNSKNKTLDPKTIIAPDLEDLPSLESYSINDFEDENASGVVENLADNSSNVAAPIGTDRSKFAINFFNKSILTTPLFNKKQLGESDIQKANPDLNSNVDSERKNDHNVQRSDPLESNHWA